MPTSLAIIIAWILLAADLIILGRMMNSNVVTSIGVIMLIATCCVNDFQ